MARPVSSFGRARLAAFLLALLFLLAAFQAAFVVRDPLDRQVVPLGFGDISLAGVVRDTQANPVPGVLVTAGGKSNVTGEDGSYRLGGLGVGVHEVRFVGRDNATLVFRVFLGRDREADVALPGPGEVARADDASVAPVALASRICGGLLLGVGLLTALGAVASWKRRKWGLALAGAIAGVFASPPLSIVLGAIAVYVVASAKKEFRG